MEPQQMFELLRKRFEQADNMFSEGELVFMRHEFDKRLEAELEKERPSKKELDMYYDLIDLMSAWGAYKRTSIER